MDMLIVIDMQEDFCADDGAYACGGVDIRETQAIVPNVHRLLDYAHQNAIPSIATLFTIYTDMHGEGLIAPTLLSKRPFLKQNGFRLGSHGHQSYHKLPKSKYEIVKPRYSAFYATPLDILVRSLGVTQVTIAGITTGGGVAATARDAHLRDLPVTIVQDAVASPHPGDKETALQTLREVGHVCDTNSWLSRR